MNRRDALRALVCLPFAPLVAKAIQREHGNAPTSQPSVAFTNGTIATSGYCQVVYDSYSDHPALQAELHAGSSDGTTVKQMFYTLSQDRTQWEFCGGMIGPDK